MKLPRFGDLTSPGTARSGGCGWHAGCSKIGCAAPWPVTCGSAGQDGGDRGCKMPMPMPVPSGGLGLGGWVGKAALEINRCPASQGARGEESARVRGGLGTHLSIHPDGLRLQGSAPSDPQRPLGVPMAVVLRKGVSPQQHAEPQILEPRAGASRQGPPRALLCAPGAPRQQQRQQGGEDPEPGFPPAAPCRHVRGARETGRGWWRRRQDRMRRAGGWLGLPGLRAFCRNGKGRGGKRGAACVGGGRLAPKRSVSSPPASPEPKGDGFGGAQQRACSAAPRWAKALSCKSSKAPRCLHCM